MADGKMKYKASMERKVITYADFWHTSSVMLENAKNVKRGSYHQLLGSIVFSAFSLEAFLNHMGEPLFKSWKEIERKLSPKQKTALICEKVNLLPNYGHSPWQVVPKLTAFRNMIAHGKSKLIMFEKTITCKNEYEEAMHLFLESTVDEFVNQKNAESVRIELEDLFALIHDKAQIPKDRLFFSGFQTGTGTQVRDFE